MTDSINRDARFLARFAVLVVLLTFIYLAAVTFVPLQASGIKYADIAVPLLLGTVIGGLMGFWYGASKAQPPAPPAAAAVAPPRPLPGAVPTGTVSDPVAVTEVPSPTA